MQKYSQLIINLSLLLSKPTGISNYARNIFPHLKSLKPILLTSREYEEFDNHLIPNDLTPEQGTIGHIKRLLWTQFKLPKIYQKLNSSLLFSPAPEIPLWSSCRSVVVVHDLIPLRFPNKKSPLHPYFKYYIPKVLQQAEHIICNSQATAKDIHEILNIPSYKITPILLAYDKKHFRLLNSNQNKNKSDIPYFLYLGRHDPHKNITSILKAFSKLKDYKSYELWLVGPKDKRYTLQLQILAKELGISKQLKVLDYVSYQELPLLLNEALALVFPSLWEGFGFPVLEAMACGAPVITSNISSLPEVTGDAALLINPYVSKEITYAMEQIITDNSLRSQLKILGLKRAKAFSWKNTGEKTLAILANFL